MIGTKKAAASAAKKSPRSKASPRRATYIGRQNTARMRMTAATAAIRLPFFILCIPFIFFFYAQRAGDTIPGAFLSSCIQEDPYEPMLHAVCIFPDAELHYLFL
jgi:hypothetical protein